MQVQPLYAQIKDQILEWISAGKYAAGERLPSQRELTAQSGASHMTVRRAIRELTQAGVIAAVPGKGLFVNEPKRQAERFPLRSFTEEMERRGMRASSRLLAAEVVPASTLLGRVFAVPVGEALIYLRRLRLADGEPIAIQAAYLRAGFCPGLLSYDLESRSLYEILRGDFGIRFQRGEISFEAALADAEQAALLEANLPLALLVSEQLTFSRNGSLIEFVRSVYRGDRFRIGL